MSLYRILGIVECGEIKEIPMDWLKLLKTLILYVTFKSTFSNLLINKFRFKQLHAKSSPDIIYGQSLNGSTDGEEPLEGNAHDDVCLAGHQDVLQRVEEVGEEGDVDRGLEAEGVVEDDQEQEEDLHRGQGH